MTLSREDVIYTGFQRAMKCLLKRGNKTCQLVSNVSVDSEDIRKVLRL